MYALFEKDTNKFFDYEGWIFSGLVPTLSRVEKWVKHDPTNRTALSFDQRLLDLGLECQQCGHPLKRLSPAEEQQVANNPYAFIAFCRDCANNLRREYER